MLISKNTTQCWPTVCDDNPVLRHHWFNICVYYVAQIYANITSTVCDAGPPLGKSLVFAGLRISSPEEEWVWISLEYPGHIHGRPAGIRNQDLTKKNYKHNTLGGGWANVRWR